MPRLPVALGHLVKSFDLLLGNNAQNRILVFVLQETFDVRVLDRFKWLQVLCRLQVLQSLGNIAYFNAVLTCLEKKLSFLFKNAIKNFSTF